MADLGPDADEKLKVYRGYVALAVLTRYASFNYTGMIGGYADLNFQSYSGMQDDAMSTLARIDFADKMLRLGSGIPQVANKVDAKDIAGNPTLAYIKLIAPEALGQPGKLHDIEKLHRTLAVLMVGVGAEKPTVAREEVEGMESLAVLPGEKDWNYWANVIQDSCNHIASATGSTSHCAGGWMKAKPMDTAKAGNETK